MNGDYDVAIVGGGVVGAALSLMLAQGGAVPASRILLVERERPAPFAPDAPFDLRVSAISPANQHLLQSTGVWQKLDPARIATYQRMVVWHEDVPADSPDVLRFDAAEMGEPHLGAIVENRALQLAMLSLCDELGIAQSRAEVASVQFGVECASLDLGEHQALAQLVVGADGAHSRVREAAGIAARLDSYHQQAIVATVHGSRGHRDTAWQCFLRSGPLALLPLASGECSIVWSCMDAEAERLMALPEETFNLALTAASDGALGDITLRGKRARFPLQRLSAERYMAPRCVLVGDSAHVIHPLAGQGVNQGLQDAAALTEALAARPRGESVAALRALRRYERERRAGNATMGAVVDGFDRVFTGNHDFAAWAAREGMALVNRAGMAKRFFFTRAAAGRSSLRR